MAENLTGGRRGARILDGIRLARERAPGLAARAGAVASRRGAPPRLALVAFADADGRSPYTARKLRACAAAGVEVTPLILPASVTTAAVRREVETLLDREPHDGVFVEFPFPEGVEEAGVVAGVPEAADVDVMTPCRIRRYLSGEDPLPPVTVSAGLELLDAYRVDVAGLRGVVVSDPIPFAEMFRESLVRRGARMEPVLPPDAPDLARRVGEAGLVVVSAGRPGLLRSGELAPGAVVIDVGYFNPGGRGDVDLADGVDHLAAVSAVPGGIGPMTVSVLVERVIEFAERR